MHKFTLPWCWLHVDYSSGSWRFVWWPTCLVCARDSMGHHDVKKKDGMAVHEDGWEYMTWNGCPLVVLQTNFKFTVCIPKASMSSEVLHFSIGWGPLWVLAALSPTKTMFIDVWPNYAIILSSDNKVVSNINNVKGCSNKLCNSSF